MNLPSNFKSTNFGSVFVQYDWNFKNSLFWWARIYNLTLNQRISAQFLGFEQEIVFRNGKRFLHLLLLKFRHNKSIRRKTKFSLEYTSETSALLFISTRGEIFSSPWSDPVIASLIRNEIWLIWARSGGWIISTPTTGFSNPPNRKNQARRFISNYGQAREYLHGNYSGESIVLGLNPSESELFWGIPALGGVPIGPRSGKMWPR